MEFDMDKLTLEYFTNKQTYNKYLAKKDPTNYLKKESVQKDAVENHDCLLELFSQMICSKFDLNNNTLQSKYEIFVEACLDHLDKSKTDFIESTEVDEDVIFTKCDDLGIQPSNPIEFWKMQNVKKEP